MASMPPPHQTHPDLYPRELEALSSEFTFFDHDYNYDLSPHTSFQPDNLGFGLAGLFVDCALGNITTPSSQDNWRYATSEPNVKVGRYSAEERKDRILRYLKKRNQRNFNKTIKYACRKTLADRRIRVRGRFARNNELSEEETISKNNIVNGVPDHKECEIFSGETIQLKHDDEDWLQEAMASLMYLPCV